MTPEAQQIAIAKARGWTDIRRPCDSNYHDLPTDTLRILYGQVCGIPPGWVHSQNSRPLPDYLNDLNAMHEAEKVKIIGTEYESDYCMYLYENAHQCFATAPQRAEAFLRTLNLWTL